MYLAKLFVVMAKYLLTQPGIKFLLSERFSEDPVELFLGKQRAQSGYNDIPTVQQFLRNTVSLRIQGTVATDPTRRNHRMGSRFKDDTTIDEMPLPKRRKVWFDCY